MATVVAFDVNETLLDLRALDSVFERTVGDASLRPKWFATMLAVSFTGTITGRYIDFTTAQHAALRMVAPDVSDNQADEVVGGMRLLPAHTDVVDGLDYLAAAGFRLVALTNSVLETAQAQLSNAGIRDRFEAVYSADEVRHLKPSPEPYLMAAARSGVDPAAMWLVAAHAWDVSGAMAAGCRAAFLARPGMRPSPVGPQPEVVADDLRALATGLERAVEQPGS